MKILVVVGFVALLFAVGVHAASSRLNGGDCKTGQAKGFAAVQGDPRLGGIGALPSKFTSAAQFFKVKYNCEHQNVLARRLDEGIYEVTFPGVKSQIAVASVTNDQASTISVIKIGDAFRVRIRGPIENNNILIPRELPFYIVIY